MLFSDSLCCSESGFLLSASLTVISVLSDGCIFELGFTSLTDSLIFLNIPFKIGAGKRVAQVAAGNEHTACVTTTGESDD